MRVMVGLTWRAGAFHLKMNQYLKQAPLTYPAFLH
jgi:hypothetical protein